MQFVDLALEGSRHDPLAQAFNAVHLGFHQAASVVTIPVFPKLAPETSACGNRRIAVCKGIAFAQPGIHSRRNDRRGIALHDRRMHGLGVVAPIAGYGQQRFLGGNLCEQLRHHGSVTDIVGCDTNSSYLQRLCINADMHLATLAPAIHPMFFASPPTFAQELDARGVNQQM